MFDIYLRYHNSSDIIQRKEAWAYLNKAAFLGHINASIQINKISDNELDKKLKIYSKYEKYTPLATEEKILLLIEDNNTAYKDEINKLNKAGLCIGIQIKAAIQESSKTLVIEKDLLCEKCYKDCTVYKLKEKPRIKYQKEQED